MTWQRWVTVLSLQAVLIGTISFSQRSVADGALAVGVSANIARDGVAAGWAVNHTKLGDAEKKAMELCLGYEAAGAPARTYKIVDTFVKECLAIAMDPEVGTDGFGWAVSPTSESAEDKARAECRGKANSGRERFCKVVASCCDGRQCTKGASQ